VVAPGDGGNSEPPPTDGDDFKKTPPLPMRGRALFRATGILLAFTVAGSTVEFIRTAGGESSWSWWNDDLAVLGFFLGVAVAAFDYVWQRRR
jgi:hypothetical protein